MSKTILLADDSVTIQKVIELTFMDQGYEVISVSNGDDAVDRLGELAPDLVIADVHMPGANGYEVAKRAKELRPAMPVLLLVGTFEPFDDDRARAAGADRHLKKPFDASELLDLVEELTRSAPAAPPAAEAPAEPAETSDSFLTAEADELDLGPGGEPFGPPPATRGALEPELGEDEEPFGDLSLEEEEAAAEVFAAEPAASIFDDLEPEPEPEPLDLDLPGETYALESEMLEGDAVTAEYKAEGYEPEEPGETAAAAPEAEELSPADLGVPPAAAPLGGGEPMAEAGGGEVPFPLSDDDVDRIARRVVELLGKDAVREVAWEVVPDLAELLIKDRIRELEAAVERSE